MQPTIRAAARRARHALDLPQQRDPDVARRPDRRGEQCPGRSRRACLRRRCAGVASRWRVAARADRATRRQYGFGKPATPRRSPAGTSTCGPTAPGCRRAAAASRRARRSTTRNARRCHGTFGESNDYMAIAGGVGHARSPTSRCARPAASSTTRRRCSTTSAARCRSTRRRSLTDRRGLRADRLRAEPERHPARRRGARPRVDRSTVRMPNRDGFTTAARLDARGRQARHARNVACMTNCAAEVRLSSRDSRLRARLARQPRRADARRSAPSRAMTRRPAARRGEPRRRVIGAGASCATQVAGCTACHGDRRSAIVGPAFRDVARTYAGDAGARGATRRARCRQGGVGRLGRRRRCRRSRR